MIDNKDIRHIATLLFGIVLGLFVAYISIPASQRAGYTTKLEKFNTYNIKLGDKEYCSPTGYDCETLSKLK